MYLIYTYNAQENRNINICYIYNKFMKDDKLIFFYKDYNIFIIRQ